MKLLNENEDAKNEFKPFDLNIRIETKEEAKLLFHVFDHPELKKALFHDRNITGQYTENIIKNFNYADRNAVVIYILDQMEK